MTPAESAVRRTLVQWGRDVAHTTQQIATDSGIGAGAALAVLERLETDGTVRRRIPPPTRDRRGRPVYPPVVWAWTGEPTR